MAKYEEYVKKVQENEPDLLTEELTAAQTAKADRVADTSTGDGLPDDWADKSVTEAFQDYSEIQKAYSRQGNELGELRKTVDQLILLEDSIAEPAPQEADPVTMDNLYEDPDASIRRIVQEESTSQIQETAEQLLALQQQLALTKFSSEHPDWEKHKDDPKFQNWVADSNYRQRLWSSANNWDLDAAADLFNMYGDASKDASSATNDRREAELSAANLESSGSGEGVSSEDTYSRKDLMDYRIRAKKGDLVASNWLKEHNPAITRAYADGRIED